MIEILAMRCSHKSYTQAIALAKWLKFGMSQAVEKQVTENRVSLALSSPGG